MMHVPLVARNHSLMWHETVIEIVAGCLRRNLRRKEWSSDQLATLATVTCARGVQQHGAADDLSSVIPLLRGEGYWRMGHDALGEACLAAAAQLRPPTEAANQQFWFEYICG